MSRPPAAEPPVASLFDEPDPRRPKALRLLEHLDEMLSEVDQTLPPEDQAFHEATAWAAILRGSAGQDDSESWKVFWRRWVKWHSVQQNRAAYERVNGVMERVAKKRFTMFLQSRSGFA